MNEFKIQTMTTQPTIQQPVLQTPNIPIMQPTCTPDDMGNLLDQIKLLKEQMERLMDENMQLKTQLQELWYQSRDPCTEFPKNFTSGSLTEDLNEDQCDEIMENQRKLIEKKTLFAKGLYRRTFVSPSTPFKIPDSDEEERIVEYETRTNQGIYNEFPSLTNEAKNKKRKRSNTPSPKKSTSSGKLEHVLKKSDKPPNITVCAPKLEVLNAALKDIPHKKTCIPGTSNVKLTLPSGDEYCKIRKIFDESQNKFEWYTYENKQTRPLKVMARGLHPETPLDDIRDDLASQGFNVVKVDQKYRVDRDKDNKIIYVNGKRRYTHLPLFMLSFDKDTTAKKVFEIRYICNMKITIEALKRNNQIPQCKNCQEFNHTNKYCNKIPKCVKCGEKHLTSDCKKALHTNPKCANCGGNHPANFRGCEVFLKIQKKRDELNNKKSPPTNATVKINSQAQNLSNTKVNQNLMFSQAVKNSMGNQKNQCINKQIVNENDMLVFMNTMMQKFDALLKSNNQITNRLNSIENKSQKNKNNKNNKNG